MYFDAKELITFCGRNKITVEQFVLCYLTHKKKFDLIYKYSNEVRPFPKSLVENLEKRGFIINLNKDGEGFPDNLVIQDVFLDDMRLTMGEFADEIWEMFPSEVSVGGKAFNGKTISREDFNRSYTRLILKVKATHNEIIEALEEQIHNHTVGMGLKKWFETEQWTREDNTIDITNDL